MLRKIIELLVYSVVLLLPLYLVRFSIFDIPTNMIEILVIIAFSLWITDIKLKIPPAPFIKGEGLALTHSIPKIYRLSFLLIFLGLTISAFLNPNWTREAGIIKGWFAMPFLFFLIILDQFQSVDKINKIVKFLFVSSATVGLVSLYYLLTDNLTFDGRLQAFYPSPNHLAMFLAPGIIIGTLSTAKIFLEKKKLDISFYFLTSSLLIMLIALYFTFSYGAWLALFFSLLITLLLTKLLSRPQKNKLLFAFIFLFLFSFSFQFSNQKLAGIINLDPRSSFASRIMIWKSAWMIGTDNFVWGIGPGNFQEKYLAYQKYFPPYLEWAVPEPHNLYLAFWLQTGLLGLVGFSMLVWHWMLGQIKFIRQQKNGSLRAIPFSIILYFLIHGLVDTPYWKNDLAFLFWTVIALGIVGAGQCSVPTLASSNERDGRRSD